MAQIGFNTDNLRWNNVGSELSINRKNNGYAPGDLYPASEVNWQFNQIYQFIQQAVTAVNTNSTDIATNTTNITNNTTSITTNETNISNNDTAIGNNSTAIGNNTTAISNNATALTNLSSTVTSLQSTVNTNTSDISDNTTNITNSAAAIVANTTAISNNTTTIGTNTTNITNNTSRIATNETAISNNAGAITTNASNINTNTGSISTNTNNISNTNVNLGLLNTRITSLEDAAGSDTIEYSSPIVTRENVIEVGKNLSGTDVSADVVTGPASNFQINAETMRQVLPNGDISQPFVSTHSNQQFMFRATSNWIASSSFSTSNTEATVSNGTRYFVYIRLQHRSSATTGINSAGIVHSTNVFQNVTNGNTRERYGIITASRSGSVNFTIRSSGAGTDRHAYCMLIDMNASGLFSATEAEMLEVARFGYLELNDIRHTLATCRLISRSQNLYDVKRAHHGSRVNSDGTFSNSTTLSRTDHIIIAGETTLRKTIFTSYAFYNADGNFISYNSGTSDVISVPNDAYTVILNFPATVAQDTLMVKIGSATAPVTPYRESIAYIQPLQDVDLTQLLNYQVHTPITINGNGNSYYTLGSSSGTSLQTITSYNSSALRVTLTQGHRYYAYYFTSVAGTLASGFRYYYSGQTIGTGVGIGPAFYSEIYEPSFTGQANVAVRSRSTTQATVQVGIIDLTAAGIHDVSKGFIDDYIRNAGSYVGEHIAKNLVPLILRTYIFQNVFTFTDRFYQDNSGRWYQEKFVNDTGTGFLSTSTFTEYPINDTLQIYENGSIVVEPYIIGTYPVAIPDFRAYLPVFIDRIDEATHIESGRDLNTSEHLARDPSSGIDTIEFTASSTANPSGNVFIRARIDAKSTNLPQISISYPESRGALLDGLNAQVLNNTGSIRELRSLLDVLITHMN